MGFGSTQGFAPPAATPGVVRAAPTISLTPAIGTVVRSAPTIGLTATVTIA